MFALVSLFSSNFWSISFNGKTLSIRDGSDYGSDVPTDFELEMFCNTTSKTTDKSIFVAGRTQNVETR